MGFMLPPPPPRCVLFTLPLPALNSTFGKPRHFPSFRPVPIPLDLSISRGPEGVSPSCAVNVGQGWEGVCGSGSGFSGNEAGREMWTGRWGLPFSGTPGFGHPKKARGMDAG